MQSTAFECKLVLLLHYSYMCAVVFDAAPLLSASAIRARQAFWVCTLQHPCHRTPPPRPSCHTTMTPLSATTKHHILLEYSPRSPTRTLSALAARHGIRGGDRTLRRWLRRWDGTPQSLEHKAVSGRPHVLNSRQVQQYVRAPLLRANRAYRAVHYPQLLESVRLATGKNVSLRTLQRCGKEEQGARCTRGKKRTADERECIHTRKKGCAAVLVQRADCLSLPKTLACQCQPTCASRSPR